MTDDQRYGVSGTFGGGHPDTCARSRRQSWFSLHAVSLYCSVFSDASGSYPGRNHHSVGFGVIGELATGYPGYDSVIGPDHATIGKILKENGYAVSSSR